MQKKAADEENTVRSVWGLVAVVVLVTVVSLVWAPPKGETQRARTVPTPMASNPGLLITQLDAAWAKGDWEGAIRVLDRLESVDPNALDFTDKRYAAHVNHGAALQQRGQKQEAAKQFSSAYQVDMNRIEARERLLALTPTPVPSPTPIPQPTATAVPRIMDIIVGKGNWAYSVVSVRKQETVAWSPFGNKTTAKGTWLIILLVVGNASERTMTIRDWDFELRDDAGRKYEMDTVTSLMFNSHNKVSSLGEQFPPGVPVPVGMLYDVNPDAKAFRLHLKQAGEFIDLVEK